MKNTEKNLDEIIFEKRNQAYGAYALRKSYSKNVIGAMVIAFTIFLMGVSIPLIASYMNTVKYVPTNGKVEVIIDKIHTKVDIPLPEPPKPKVARVPVFTPPVVTMNSDEVVDDFGDIMSKVVNRGVDTIGSVDIPDDKKVNDVIYVEPEVTPPTIVDEMPEFPGGDAARIKFFSENVKYPMVARETGVQGAVYLTFVVEKDGSISQVKLLRGIGAGCDEEASRVVGMMPKWNPGRQNGNEVRVQFNMPISFILK